MVQPLHIRGAHIWDGHQIVQRDLYTTDRVLDKPAPGAITVDLDGYTIFPGLINAHDHLELNHYPRSKFRDRYDNAHQWGEDMNARLDTEPYKSLRAYPLWDKLFIGGLKNLLCGATTVAHHNPPHKELWHKDFPVRVLRKYGWSHSLHFSTDEEIVRSYRSTPPDVPWFIHLAEGTDDVAAGEFQRLKNLGCWGKNAVLIHAVGLTENELDELYNNPTIGGIVSCPTTNEYLLGISPWKSIGRLDGTVNNVVLGCDSRLTATSDLLSEMRYATVTSEGSRHHSQIIKMVTMRSADLFKISELGKLSTNAYADWLAFSLPPKDIRRNDYVETIRPDLTEDEKLDLTSSEHFVAAILCYLRRADLTLVVKGGVPQIGDPDVMAKFPHIKTIPATLDGKPKRIQSDLAERINKCKLKEPGLELGELPKRTFRLWN